MNSVVEQHILDLVDKKVSELYGESVELSLTTPPEVSMGDFALECFPMAKLAKKAPTQIATELAEQVSPDEIIESASAVGPYVNFKIHNHALFQSGLDEVLKTGDKYGVSKTAHRRKVMVEYLSPNTNKPLHLGHMRNGYLGMAVITLLQQQGHDVIKTCIINDRGISICKSMLAWQKWGDDQTPEDARVKPDHFVGDWYVRFAKEEIKDPELIEEAQDLLRKWEQGDPDTVALWKQMNGWVYEGWDITERVLGFTFDQKYFESQVYKFGKDIIEQGVANGVFKKTESGSVIFDLDPAEFGLDENKKPRKITVIREDGTSLYVTQDIGLAVTRAEEHKLEQLIYVVGAEQTYHFQTFFALLKALGHAWAQNLYHLSYGMVSLPEGKMKSREGTVVDADDLIAEVIDMAVAEIRSREHGKDLSEEEVEKRAKVIGLGAIRFFFLRTKSNNEIHFDPKESVSFEGFTGPYVQYAHARACSILRAAGGIKASSDYSVLGSPEERMLLQKLQQFPHEVLRATNDFNPSAVAVHTFEVAKAFNHFYSGHPVVKAETPELLSARVALVKATTQVIKNGLALLGIEAPEEM